ncbi:hypothetical protein [Bacillus cereus]|uniref:hypothetical protein n=1 Tax=Bacillus cereus TaxID=1396 RepID=UPI001155C8A0
MRIDAKLIISKEELSYELHKEQSFEDISPTMDAIDINGVNYKNNGFSSAYDSRKFGSESKFDYKVVKDGVDLGTKLSLAFETEGMIRLSLLAYNNGEGIKDATPFQVYAVDPETKKEYLITNHQPKIKKLVKLGDNYVLVKLKKITCNRE